MPFSSFDRTAVMGILNITPDSFSDGGQFFDAETAVRRAKQIEREGAAILDVGAQSTRPGATPLSPEDEWARLAPVLTALQGQLTIPVSVDTFEPFVAERALANGAAILNDVSGSSQNGFPALAAKHGAGLIMMARDAAHPADIRTYFETAIAAATTAGLPLSRLCLDIGIGFHQTRDVDLAAIKHLPDILDGLPKTAVLCGASRKRVIAYCAGDSDPADRLGGTVALHTTAQLRGATVLRVHDVKEAVQAAAVIDRLIRKEEF
ncbi:MAG: dihydropteroate synthase [Clostridia bacterium]|nr:dihydropteroate synthase [Clostridia bacterium]